MASSTPQMVDLIGQLAALNVQYLGISVGVILGTGILVSVAIPVLLYFLNFRPNKIRLSKLEVEIKAEKESNSSKFEELLNKQIKSFQDLEVSINTEKESNEARFERFLQAQEKRFGELLDKMKSLEKVEEGKLKALQEETYKLYRELKGKNQELEVTMAWSDHYMWEGRNILSNALLTSIVCLEGSFAHGVRPWLRKMCFDSVENLVDKESSLLSAEKGLFSRLEAVLPKVTDEIDSKQMERVKQLIAKAKTF